jgi:L-ribulose-5-phosphate 3-epimerase
MQRRDFLGSSAMALSLNAQGSRLPIRKGVLTSMLPEGLSWPDKMAAAKEAGFVDIEAQTTEDPKEVAAIGAAAKAAGLRIHSVMNMAHWKHPLSSDNPADVEKSMAGMRLSLENAKAWGSDTVLLVPAVVNPRTRYEDAWKRSTKQIRELLPMAAEYKVTIAIENVWNKFLLSPLEMARYIDDFRSPWVKAYFDVGNIQFYGYATDWIYTLNNRIAKVHFKDFSFRKGVTNFSDLRDGDLDWKGIHKAFADIGYKNTATVELRGGDVAYLKEVSRRVDLILEGV